MKINYNQLVDQAVLNHMVKNILMNIMEGAGAQLNEIYLTFDTTQAQMSSKLKILYPAKMSIMLCNNNYQSLTFEDNTIIVTMSFSIGTDTIHIPLSSLIQFMDRTNEYAVNFTPIKKPVISTTDNNEDKIVRIDFNS